MTFGLQTEEYVSRSILDGKHRHDAPPVEGRFTTAVGKAGAMYLERYWHQREFETIEKLRGIAEQAGESLAKTSLAWVLANPLITSAIIGASHADQLTESLAAADLALDPEPKAQLDDTTTEYRWGEAAR